MAGPVEFGLAQYNAALDARNLKQRIKYDVSLEPAESFRIEPYAAGGAHISGGDLRGLMYALLEAADQIRATGRMKQTHSVPSIAVRAIRRFARDDLADWQPYFEMLARDRFNRLTLIYTEPPTDLKKLRAISQLAADYAVDFTLALWFAPDESVAKVLASCPLIRTIQIREPGHNPDAYRTLVFKPMLQAGRRIALDPDPEIVEAARAEGVAIRSDPQGWPPNFEIEAPVDYAAHAEFYWLWGRLGYDPKSKPAHGENADEVAAAAQIVALMSMAKAPPNDWIASPTEAGQATATSAKLTGLDLAMVLARASAELSSSAVPDLQWMSKAASDQASRLRDRFGLPASATAGLSAEQEVLVTGSAFGVVVLTRPQFTHVVVRNATPDQPINLTLQIAPIKDVRLVRLHYRPVDSGATSVIEKPAAASVAFTIPPVPSDILYYFEIIGKSNSGWFEPDPLVATPYHVIHVEPKPPQ